MNEDQEFRNVINILKQLQQVKAPAEFDAALMRKINSQKIQVRKTLWATIFIPSRMVPAAALAITAILLIFVLNNSGITSEDPFSVVPRQRHDLSSSILANNIPPVTKNKVESAPVEKKSDEDIISRKSLTGKDESTNEISNQTVAPQVQSLKEEGGLQKGAAIQEDRLEAKSLEKIEITKPEAKLTAPKTQRQISKPTISGNVASNKPLSDKYITVDYTPDKMTNYQIDKASLNFRQIRISDKQRKELNYLKQKMESMFGK